MPWGMILKFKVPLMKTGLIILKQTASTFSGTSLQDFVCDETEKL